MDTKPKNIQIPYSFYLNLLTYAICHSDLDDPHFEQILDDYKKKRDAMDRHELYTLYKTGASAEIRKQAREDYLKAIGLDQIDRWCTEHDANVMHNPDALI